MENYRVFLNSPAFAKMGPEAGIEPDTSIIAFKIDNINSMSNKHDWFLYLSEE